MMYIFHGNIRIPTGKHMVHISMCSDKLYTHVAFNLRNILLVQTSLVKQAHFFLDEEVPTSCSLMRFRFWPIRFLLYVPTSTELKVGQTLRTCPDRGIPSLYGYNRQCLNIGMSPAGPLRHLISYWLASEGS